MVKRAIILMIIFGGLLACSKNSNSYQEKDGVVIYYKNDFNRSKKGFHGSRKVKQSLIGDAISGKALLTICKQKWSGPMLDINIKGSKGLKVAFFAKGENFQFARLNMFDSKSDDNTTPYDYRFLFNNRWMPVLYYVDTFRYNSKNRGFIKNDTHFKNIRFWSPDPKGKQVSIILDNFIVYRGEDKTPPTKVKDLRAYVTKKGIKLDWKEAEDNVFPMVYVISRAKGSGKFKKIAESYHPYYLDTTVGIGEYRYRVLACDFENNIGKWSDIVSVKSKINAMSKILDTWEKDRANYAFHVREIHKKGVGRVQKGQVVLYGDSLTGPTLYPRFVAGALGIYRVRAYGYAGMTTGWGKKNVDKKILNRMSPEFMFIMFGTNNVRGRLRDNITYKKWADDVIQIAKKAEKKGIVPVIGTIPPRGFKDPTSKPEAQFNEILIKEARKNRIPVAYVFNEVQNAGDRHEFIWRDGVHWTAKGMEVAAIAWAKTMREVEFVLRDRP